MKRKFFALLFVMLFTSGAWGAYYDEGNDGDSWETAYVINSAEDFIMVRDRVSSYEEPSEKYYKLNSDIDLTAETDWEGINMFQGHFDGQNHTITFNSQTNVLYAALFEYVTVANDQIAIRNLNVTGTVNASCAGTIVHYLVSGIIDNCTFTGTITTSNTASAFGAGGIAAHMSGGTIRNCKVSANISAASYGGGIAGALSGGNIENCTVESNTRITARNVGGIAGEISSPFNGNISGCTWPKIYSLAGSGSYTPTITEITWNGHRYQIYNENLTWEQAKLRCEALGGHLATITSQAEQNEIEELLRGARKQYYGYWLGAKADELGFWHWVTDEVFERQYSNFASDQPDGSGNYLQIYAQSPSGYEYYYVIGKWDDTANNGTNSGLLTEHGFICEWDDEPEQVETAPLNPKFLEWQDNPSPGEYGAIPSPLNTSHLKGNPPSDLSVNSSRFFIAAKKDEPYYDGRTEINLPEARNQGNFGTCWAFATIGAMEANYKKQKMNILGENPDLSELHLAWFAYRDPNFTKSPVNSTVLNKGGNPDTAASYLMLKTGPVNEESMPYTAAGNNSDMNAFINNRTAGSFDKVKISLKEKLLIGDRENLSPNNIDYIYLFSSDISEIKSLIVKYGAVYIHYYSNDVDYDEVHSSYYSKNDGTEHAVLLVGWNDNFSRDDFKIKPERNGAWLVRNSWGSDFGDNGYFWMSYNQMEDLGISNGRVFVVEEDSNAENTEIKGSSEKNKDIDVKWSAALFRAERDEKLITVGINTTDNNVQYDIFVNNFGKLRPADPGDAETPLFSGYFSRAGSHIVDLPETVFHRGDYYAVIVKITLSSDYGFPTGVAAAIANYSSIDVNEGENFFATGEPVPALWEDGKTIEGGPYKACITVETEPILSYAVEPAITTSALNEANEGERYNFTLTASGTQPIEWRGGNLPSGLSLSRQGVLDGVISESGEFNINITAFNEVSVDTKTFTLTVKPQPQIPSEDVKPIITSSLLPEARTGLFYTYTFEASGTGSIEWSGEDIPENLALSSSGVLSGRVIKAGEYEIKITASNSAGSDAKSFTLKVNEITQTSDDITPVVNNSSGGCSSGFGVSCWILGLIVFMKRR